MLSGRWIGSGVTSGPGCSSDSAEPPTREPLMAEPSSRRVEELFDQVVDMDPAQRAAFLDERCQGAAALRAAVEELLDLDRRAQAEESLLRSPLVGSRPKAPAPPWPLTSTIGRYSVVRVLGEGGMGTVYEAEQDNPRRTVA